MRTLAVFSFPVCVQTGGLLSCLCHSSLKNTSWTLGDGVRDRMRAGRPASQQATPLRGAGIIPSTSTSFQSSSLVPVCCTLILLAADGLCVSSALPWGCGMRGGRGMLAPCFFTLSLWRVGTCCVFVLHRRQCIFVSVHVNTTGTSTTNLAFLALPALCI